MSSSSDGQTLPPKSRKKIDMDTGKRFLQFLLLIMEFVLMGLSLWPSCWIVIKLSSAETSAFQWTLIILLAVLVFNYVYLLCLLLLRIILPVPKEGFYPINQDENPPLEVFIFLLNVLLVILRLRPPWAAYISSLLVNIFPLNYFFRRYFGPDTPSTTLGDTYNCIDPYLIKAGKNVQFGGFCGLAGHLFDHKGLTIAKIEIGDNVIIGAEASIGPGVKIGNNSIVSACSRVVPFTVIGENEFWLGAPARRFRSNPKPEQK
jgi:hypothetical protein